MKINYSWPKNWHWLALLLVYFALQVPALAKPMISVIGFAPTSQTVGNTVTIIGSDLNGVTVTFSGGRVGVVTSVTNGSTVLTVIVPDSCQSGPMVITRGTDTPVTTSSITILNVATTCAPSNGNGCSAVSIRRVNITGSLDQTSTCQGSASGSYVAFPVSTNTTASLTAGTSFILNATLATSTGNVAAFIDWNRNGTFESNEYYSLGTGVAAGSTASLAITVPSTAAGLIAGLTTMRIRAAATAIGSGNACTAYTTGETQDFYITLAPSQSAPAITSFSPSSASVGSTITVTGNVLQNGTFTINGVAIAAVINGAGNSAVLTIPSGVTSGRISIVTPGGSTSSSGSLFIIGANDIVMGTTASTVSTCSSNFYSPGYPSSTPAIVSSSTQLISPATAGNQVRLAFSSFNTEARFDVLTIYNGVDANAPVLGTYSGTASIGTITASNATGQLFMTFVSDNGGTGTGWVATVSCVATSGPLVTTFNPQTGAVGQSVTITGLNLQGTGATTVSIGSTLQTVTATSPTSLTFTVATGSSTGPITVTNSLGTYTTIGSPSYFLVTPTVAPTITSITPTSGLAGDSVVIIGTNLIGTPFNTIRFSTGGGGGGGFGATVRSNNGIRAVVIVPTNAVTGVITVGINNNALTGTSASFTVLGTPTFSAFQNNGGGFPSNITSTQVGNSIRILGSNLAPGGIPATITFSGGVTAVATGGGTTLIVTVPVGAITGPVTITTTAGSVQTSTLTILEGPVITSFTPTATSAGGTVTIAGSGLTGSTFFFANSTGGTTSALPSSVNAAGSSATVVVPTDAITGTVQVSTTNGTSTSTATLTINTLTFTPASGAVGSTITILYTGIALTGNPTVTINGVNAIVTNSQRTGITNYTITAVVSTGTTSGLVVVSNNGNVTTSATSFTVTVAGSAPTITSVNPNNGGAGTAIRINGTNFVTGTNVFFSGASGLVGAANIQVVSGVGITCDVPFGAVTGLITVSNSSGSANSPSQFTVTAATPTISALSPNSGSAGNTITIVGANFTASSTVSFGGVAASSVVYLGATVLQAIVPTGTAIGLVNVTVSNGTLTSSPSAFTVSAPPLTLSPTVGARGSSIIITGSNFIGATVNFGTVPGVITFNSGFDLQVAVPNSLPDGDVSVLVNTTSGSSSAGTFTVLPLPTITSFTPQSNSVNTVITVTGTNLSGVYIATINGVSVPYLEVDAFTGQITVPNDATSGFIQLFTPGGTATSATRFTVITGTPSITSFSPSTIASGSTVTISGFFLNEVSQVYFNGTLANNLNIISGNTITVTAPNIASSGYIVVVSALGNDTATLPYTLAGTQFCDANNPSVAVVSKGVLTPTATRQTVSLPIGNRYLFKFFGEVGKAYSFSTCRSGNGVSNNDSYLRIFQGSGIVPLLQDDDNGTNCGLNAGGAATNFLSSLDFIPTTSDTFTLLYTKYVCSVIEFDQLLDYSVRTVTAPAIYTFTPNSASVGNDVTIFGAGFVAGSVLTVNGTPVTYTTITPYTNGNFATRTDFTRITFTIPIGVTSGVVSINGSTGSATTTDILSIVPIGAPTIAGFTPFSGTTGTQVTITGANFTGATVRFSGVGGNAPIISQSATTLVVTVPANSVQGPITVTNASGSTTTSNSFLITAPLPTIASFTPARADRGATVVINGTGFTGVTGVTFGGIVASYTFLNDTTISAVVPSTATPGQVSVTTAGGTGTSLNAFIVNLPVPTIVTFSPTSGAEGTTVDIVGTNLSGASVYFGAVQATTVTNNTNNSVSAVVPFGAATGYIQVYNSFNNVGTSPIPFTILVPPNILSVSGTLPANYGSTLVITGTDLANSTVTVGGISYTVTANTNISITVIVPTNAVNGTLQVTNSNGTAIYGSTITINTLSPIITSASPQSAYFGTTVVLRGRNLRTATTYTFGGTTLGIPAGGIANDTLLTLQFNNRFTAYPNSILPIVVTTGQGSANSPDITYGTANPSRFCGTAFNDGGIIRPSTTEQTVIGELGAGAAWKFYASRDSVYNLNTLGNTQTRVNGRLSPDTYLSIFRISNTTTTPETGGTNDDYSPLNTLSNLDFTPTVSDTFYVTITQYPTTGGNALCNPLLQATQLAFSKRVNSTAPYISSFTVTGGTGGVILTNGVVGNTIQITGVNLPTTAQNFTLNGVTMPVAAAPGGSRPASATIQYVTIPVGATNGFIVVTTAAGTGQSQDQLIINSTTSPTITNFTPTSAFVGSRITITGTNLTGCTFTINGAVQTATGVTATTATITINSGAGTGGSITATNATNEVFTTSSAIVITQPAPTLTSFSPLSGLPGSTVTISGTGLLNPNGVTLNGMACTVVSSTASQIVVTIPTNATSGVFTVDQGTIGTASSASNFTVVQGPLITSFTPTSGAVGDTITISGSNLTASAVRFNGALAAVPFNTSTIIRAIVPAVATTGTITATTAVNTATSTGTFTVTTPLALVFGVPSGIPATICAGGTAIVSISVSGTAGVSNVYTVVGSNASGSFASPSSLGSITSNATGIISIPVTIPTTGNGAGYRYRVVASSPASTSADNGSNVSVSPIPATPTISAGGATTFCSGGSVTLTASAGSSYLWSNGSTSSSITVTTVGSYTVKVGNASGCISSSSAATVVTISTPPTTPTISASGSTTVCDGNSVVMSGSLGASGYIWSTGATTQSISATTSGSYTLNTISAGGCTSAVSNAVAVVVNPVPTTPTISASGATTFCSGGSVTLTASAGSSYIWSNGATTSSISVNASGTFTVQVVNASGCTSAVSASTVVTVSAAPATPTITASGSTTICDGGTVTLNGPTSPGTYFWSNGATTQNITVNTAGTYSLVTILGGTCTSAVSNAVTVTVNPVPSTPTITPSGATTFCNGGSVTLAASATGAASYLWSTGATTQNISVLNGGSYTVQAISSLGCTSSASVAVPVTVNSLPSTPIISALGSTSFCNGNSVTLNGPAGASSYIWSNGATTQNITVSTANTYSLLVTNSNGCTSSVSNAIAVTVNSLPTTPTISASGSTTFCTGGSVTLTASSGTSYLWSTGATTASISVNNTGNYSVRVINGSGCSSAVSAATAVTVNTLPTTPTISTSGSTTFCSGGSVTLTATGGSAYIWSNGATTQSISATAGGSFTVKVVNASGCTSATSAATVVIVNSLPTTPTISASGATTFCDGGSVTLTATSATAYLWSNGATTRTVTATATGSFSVQLINASGCTSSASAATMVTVNPLPVATTASASDPLTFCTGGSVDLSAPSAAGYIWSNGATTQTITATTNGTFSYRLISAAGCTSASSTATTVSVVSSPATPAITASSSTTICNGTSVGLTSSAGSSYLWSNGATTQSISATTAGNYTVQVRNANGCISAASPATVVSVNATPSTPTISSSSATTFCSNDSIYLTASGGTRYLWNTGDTTASIKVKTSGTFTVQANTASGCLSAASAPITTIVNTAPAKPVISASGPLAFCAGGSVTLTAPTSDSYLWSTLETTQSITVSSSADITVTLGSTNGCNSKVSDVIRVRSIDNTIVPIAITTRGASTTVCEGSGVWVYGPVGLPAYTWNTGETSDSIFVRTADTVRLSIGDGSCNTSLSNDIIVSLTPRPTTPLLTVSGSTTICAGESVVINAPATADAYIWSNGSNGSSLTATTSGTYFLRNVSAVGGCISDTSNKVVITVLPITATPSIVSSGSSSFCEGDSVVLTAPLADAYLWSNNATTQSIVVKNTGNFSVQVGNTNTCFSDTSAVVSITVNPVPSVPIITASGSTTVCEGNTVTLSAPAAASYLWSNGFTSQDISISSTETLTVQVTNASGCQSVVSAPQVVTVNPTPALPVINSNGANTFCEGNSVVLTAPVSASYLWSTGETTQDITVSATGDYTVRTTNASGCNSAVSAPEVIVVNPVPTTPLVTLTGTTTFCEGGSATLIAPTADAYLWNDGSTTQSVTATASSTYSVQTITNAGCTSASSTPVAITVNTVPNTPEILVGGSTTFCAGGSVQLSAAVTADSYLWSNGATTASITVSTTDTLTLQAISAAGCASSESLPVIVTVNSVPTTPVVSASGATTFCEGGSVTLSAPVAEGYIWSNGATTQTIDVNATGDFSVALTTAAGCTSSVSSVMSVLVNPTPAMPVVSVTSATTFCAGGSATLTAPLAAGYIWSSGETTQTIAATTSGTYAVKVINGSACTSMLSDAISITVTPASATPVITNTGSTSLCGSSTVTLNAPVIAGASYLWSNGANTSSTTTNIAGDYTVQIVEAGACTSAVSNTITVTVNPVANTPTVTAGGPTSFCNGGSVTLTASAAASYLWSNGSTTQSIAATSSGSYTVQGINAEGCTSASSLATVVNVTNTLTTPTVSISGATSFCTGGSVILTSSASSRHIWSNGATTRSITITTDGVYSVQVTSATGCTSSASIPVAVTVNTAPSAPVINASGATTFCDGASVTLSVIGTGNYIWSDGTTGNSVTALASASYTVREISAAGCTSANSAATVVTVSPITTQPIITLSGSATFCTGGSVTLSAPLSDSYLWSTGETTQSINVSTSVVVTVQTTNAGSCQSIASSPIAVVVNTGLAQQVITPSGNTSFCDGGSVVLSAIAADRYLWSTGDTTQTITVSTSGSYSVVSSTNTGCTSSVSAPIVVTAYSATPLPVVSTSNGTTEFCDGGSVTLSAQAGFRYLWSTGDTTQSIVVSAAGNYTVTLLNNGGCSSATSAPVAITVSPVPTTPTITASNPSNTICNGSTITLTATAAAHYRWSTGDTTQSITVRFGRTYTVTLINASGCSSAVSSPLSVTVVQIPTATTISRIANDTLAAAVSTPAPASYQWYFNGSPLTGATSSTLRIIGIGTYYVTTISANGCASLASNTITITDVATKLPADLGKVYPNPFAGVFNLELNNLSEETVVLHITDVAGREVMTQEVSLQNGATKVEIAASALPNGMYNLLIDTSRGRLQSKLIKQ